ncbi:restriction endonuclease subunit S [Sediminibacter sp. Hel_I_10]|uniref:restriction endonuclease subunit S n=1 Tax=Sediminibacter sp. Hel_I_10 TaxID=1392490 RepID=UPI0004798446|nr:restriction endonuclease subunit S [Sediminibacter sp. Hel_I_10]
MVEVENKVQRYEKYKDSGVEWLGEIPLNWGLQKLKSFLTVHGRIGFRGYTVNDLVSKGEGAVTISPSNMGESNMIWDKVSYLSWQKYYESPEIIVEEGDLLIVKTASIGKIAYVRELNEKATINPQILILKNVKIDKDFFYYQLVSRVFQHQLETEKIGSTIYTISENKILNFRAIIPPLPEQTKIAQFLDDRTTKIDKAIAIKEHQISLLKERKQILIHKAVTRGLDESVNFKDSGVEWIGEIPEHWKVKRIKHLLNKSFSGGTPSTDKLDYWDGGISWVSSVDVKKDYLFKTAREISQKGLTHSSSKVAPKGALIFVTRSGILQHTFPLSILKKDMAINQDIKCLIFNDVILSEYFQKIIKGNNDRILVEVRQQAATVESIDMEAFFNLQIPVCSQNEQKEISGYIENSCKKIETAIGLKQQEIEKLKEFKSSLINGVVTGKVRVC